MDTIQVSMVTDPSEICFNDRPIINAQLVPFGTLSGNRSQLSLASAADKIVFAGGIEQNGSGFVEARTIDLYDYQRMVGRSVFKHHTSTPVLQ